MKFKVNKSLHLKSSKGQSSLPYIVVYPHVIFPYTKKNLHIVASEGLTAIEKALMGDRSILICYLRENQSFEKKNLKSLHPVATLCNIFDSTSVNGDEMRIGVEGCGVVNLHSLHEDKEGLHTASFDIRDTKNYNKNEYSALLPVTKDAFEDYIKKKGNLPNSLIRKVTEARDPDLLMSLICSNLENLPRSQKLYFLGHLGSMTQLDELSVMLTVEKEVVKLKEDLAGKVRKRLDQTQKEYLLQEQLKEIHRELGNKDDDPTGTMELERNLEAKNLPDAVREKVRRDIKRLHSLQPASPESSILRGYLELIEELPWAESSEDRIDIMAAQAILDADHYGLEEPKERILDYLAVRGLNGGTKGPILCLVGPPGTGKTSLANSIAKTLGRNFVRIALGGLRDEAEIRGHRRTYVGALPGKIIQAFKSVKTINPVILLDEIDKISNDFRGDPAAALLEVLDPEQNHNFTDHYLELPYDLSKVLFVTTANNIEDIDLPLLDRMEIIEIPSYTVYDKLHIVRDYLIPKQLRENGIAKGRLSIDDETLNFLISNYTLESGVRSLERTIAKIIRKLVRAFLREQETKAGSYARNSAFLHCNQAMYQIDGNDPKSWASMLEQRNWELNKEQVREHLGVPPFDPFEVLERKTVGFALGLAWTAVGGCMLPVEVLMLRGSREMTLTGKLGEVMKESAQIAYSLIHQLFEEYHVSEETLENNYLHIHIPEGATPKDGPSAGITLAVSMLSALCGSVVRNDVAMTGEITLTDQLLPVGGIREKVLAAHRQGIRNILLAKRNERDTENLPEQIKKSLNFHYFHSVKEAIRFLLPVPEEEPEEDEEEEQAATVYEEASQAEYSAHGVSPSLEKSLF